MFMAPTRGIKGVWHRWLCIICANTNKRVRCAYLGVGTATLRGNKSVTLSLLMMRLQLICISLTTRKYRAYLTAVRGGLSPLMTLLKQWSIACVPSTACPNLVWPSWWRKISSVMCLFLMISKVAIKVIPRLISVGYVARVMRLTFSLLSREWQIRSEEHTSELQSRGHLVCRLLLAKKIVRENATGGGDLSRFVPTNVETAHRRQLMTKYIRRSSRLAARAAHPHQREPDLTCRTDGW